jgi:LAO/AO transport system kinase
MSTPVGHHEYTAKVLGTVAEPAEAPPFDIAGRPIRGRAHPQSSGVLGHHGPERPVAGHAEPGAQADGSWLPPIIKTVATQGDGVESVRGWIEDHAVYLRETDGLARRETGRAAVELEHILADRLVALLHARLPADRFAQMVAAIAHRELDPYSAAEQLLAPWP